MAHKHHFIVYFCFWTVACVILPTLSFVQPSPRSCHDGRSTTQIFAGGNKAPMFFTETLMTEMVVVVREKVSFSVVPSPIIAYTVEHILARMSQDLSAETLSKIEQVLAAEETSSSYDDFSAEEIQAVADQVGREIADKAVVHLPMLTKEQELELVQQILRIVFQTVTTSGQERRDAWISANLKTSRDMLASEASRKELARAINKVVDIPLIGEDQEESVLEAAVDSCATTLEKLLPKDLLQTLLGESPDGLAEMKELLIQNVNEKMDLIGFNEEQEAAIIRAMVEILIDTYVNNTDVKFLLLTKKEQVEQLEDRVTKLEWELQASQARYEREQNNVKAQLEMVRQQIQQLQ